MNIVAARRAASRLDRNWTFWGLLAAGFIVSFAGFFYIGQRENLAAAGQFRQAAGDRVRAIRREVESRAVLLDVIAKLLARDSVPEDSVQMVVDAYRGRRSEGVAALWIPWDGSGQPPGDWSRIRRFASGWSGVTDTVPSWLGDGLRRAAAAKASITIPAALPDGIELLVYAVPVKGERGRLKGVAVVMARLGDVVEHGIGNIDPSGVDLAVEDAALGGRRLYFHRSRLRRDEMPGAPEFTHDVVLRFADRIWTLRASSVPAFLPGRDRWTRWNLLTVCLIASFLIAAAARETLSRAAQTRALVISKTRRLRVANRRLREEARERGEAEQRLQIAEESISMGIWDWDIAAKRTTASPELFRLFGVPFASEFPGREGWLSMIHPDDQARMDRGLEQALENGSTYEAEYRILRGDGEIRWLLTKGTIFRDDGGNPLRLLGVNIDITEFKEAELALNENQERTRRMFANASIGVVMTDLDGCIVETNDFACRITGYTREQMLTLRMRDLIHPDDFDDHRVRFEELLGGEVADYVAEVRMLRSDGAVLWTRSSASPAMDNGVCSGTVSLWEDITARHFAEEQLEYQALNDPLTGLPNRRLFDDRTGQAIAEARRSGNDMAIFYLDLDGFGTVNESLGHATGDALLVEVSQRLRGCLRASDTLARLGADEFAVIAPNLQEASDAEQVGRKLIDVVALPFHVSGHEIALTASAGISMCPRHASSAVELVRHAQAALYAARRDGRNRCCLFTPELGRALRERVEMEGQLRGAPARGEIVVHYQPEYDLRSGCLVGFEALARWKHPQLGLVSPARFIPIAEETGLIVPIGMTVLEQACRAAVRWQRPGFPPVQAAVNVSSIQFFREDFVDRVMEVLERTGLAPSLLQLELTESVVLTGFAGPAAKMAQLREQGITLAVDDFGTGYSSLSYLPRLPFQAMKIDRSFVRNLHESGDSRAMIQSLVSLAHNLNLNVVVEGVESPEELTVVRTLGCDMVQGYLLGRPSASTEKHLEGDRRLLLPSEMLTYS